MSESKQPNREQIEKRAYELFIGRGGGGGMDVEDWFAAEQELRATANQAPAVTIAKPAATAAGAAQSSHAAGKQNDVPQTSRIEGAPETSETRFSPKPRTAAGR
jgi:hypothetical protein